MRKFDKPQQKSRKKNFDQQPRRSSTACAVNYQTQIFLLDALVVSDGACCPHAKTMIFGFLPRTTFEGRHLGCGAPGFFWRERVAEW